MNTNYFLNPHTNNSKTCAFNGLNKQKIRQQKPNSVLQDDGYEDDFIDGDFTKNLIISALNNWSQQHLDSISIRGKKHYCPPEN